MPIVEIPSAAAPLTQRDILAGITLFATKAGWLEKGGEPVQAPFKLCLVLSRPCVAAHKKAILVAGITRYPDMVPRDVNSFDRVLKFLIGARDGLASPDVFYLGHLPGVTGRYCARLDSIHSIEVPTDAGEMTPFLAERRIAALHRDFARDLHLRLFQAFASLGFEDQGWPSTQDLEWLVTQGRADAAAADQAVQQLRAQQASSAAEGKQFRDSDLERAETSLAELQARVSPYEAELRRRQPVPSS